MLFVLVNFEMGFEIEANIVQYKFFVQIESARVFLQIDDFRTLNPVFGLARQQKPIRSFRINFVSSNRKINIGKSDRNGGTVPKFVGRLIRQITISSYQAFAFQICKFNNQTLQNQLIYSIYSKSAKVFRLRRD